MDEWINDNDWYCEQCDITFRVYIKNDETIINFCPSCASRELVGIEEDLD